MVEICPPAEVHPHDRKVSEIHLHSNSDAAKPSRIIDEPAYSTCVHEEGTPERRGIYMADREVDEQPVEERKSQFSVIKRCTNAFH